MTEPRTVSDLQEAVSLLEFVDVAIYESRGRRRDGDFDDLLEDNTDDQAIGKLRVNLLMNDGPEILALRAQCVTSTADIEVSYDAAVLYRKAEPVALDRATLLAFVANVGIMTLYPFLREGIHGVSSRLGFPIKLGLVRREEIGLWVNDVASGIELTPDVLPVVK